MSVYYSKQIDNVEVNGVIPYKFINMHVYNRHHQQSNLLIRLLSNNIVFAEHLHRIMPSGLPQSEVRLSDIRLISGIIVIEVYTTVTGHHPIDVLLQVRNSNGEIVHEWGKSSFTEVTG